MTSGEFEKRKLLQAIIEFKSVGLSSIEAKLASLNNYLPLIEKNLSKLKLDDKFKKQLLVSSEQMAKLKSQAEELRKKLFHFSQLELIDSKNEEELRKLITDVNALILKFEEMNSKVRAAQNLLRKSFDSIREAIKFNIEELKQYGASAKDIKNINAAFKELERRVKETGGSAALYTKFNDQLEKRKEYLREIALLEEKIKEKKFSLTISKPIIENIKQYKKELLNLDKSLTELRNKFKVFTPIFSNLSQLKSTDVLMKNIIRSLSHIQNLKPQLEAIKTEFAQIAQEAAKTGNIKGLVSYVSDLQKRAKLVKKLSTVEKASVQLQLPEREISAFVDQIKKQKADVLDMTKSYFSVDQQVSNLLAKAKELQQREKARAKTAKQLLSDLTAQLELLTKQKQLLIETYQKNKFKLAPEDVVKYKLELSNIEEHIANISKLIDKLNSKKVLDHGTLQYVDKQLAKIKTELENFSVKPIVTQLKISENRDELQKAIDEYKRLFAKLAKSGEISPTIKNNVFDKIKTIEDALKANTKESIAAAKKLTAELEKRLNTYEKLKQLKEQLLSSSKLNEKEYVGLRKQAEQFVKIIDKAAQEQLNLKKSSKEVGVLFEEAKLNAQKFLNVLREGANAEKLLIRLQRQYADQVYSLKRMIASKQRWAPEVNLKEARKELKEFEKELNNIHKMQKRIKSALASGVIDDKSLIMYRTVIGLADKYNAKLQVMKEKAKDVKASLAELGRFKWFVEVFKRASAYAGIYFGIYEIINVVRNGLSYVAEFDNAVHTMAAVFDITIPKAKTLEYQLVALGKAYGGSIDEINEAALALGRAGIATDKVVEATEVVIKMAKLTGDSIGISADAMITFTQVFQDANHPIQTLGDQLAYVANQSRMSTQDIGTFSNYALAAAKASGLTVEAINAMAIAFSNAGVNASTIGTQIRRFSSLLRDNSTAVKKFFQAIGTSQEFFAAQLHHSTKSSMEAMEWLAQRLKNMSNEDFAAAIKGMDLLAANALTLLRNNADEFLRHFRQLREGVEGELSKADYITQSYISTWERLSTAVGEAFQRMTDSIFPYVRDIGEEVIFVLNKISVNASQFMENFKNFLTAVTASLGSLAALSSVAIVVSGAASAGKTAISVFTKLKSVFKAIATMNIAASVISLRTAAVSIVPVLSKIRTIIAGIFAIISRHPIGALLTAIGTAAYYAYEKLDDVEQKAQSLSKIEQIRNEITKNLATGKELLAKKAQLEIELQKALINGDMKRAQELNSQIAAIEVQITQHNSIIEKEKQQLSILEKQKELQELMLKKQRILQEISKLKLLVDDKQALTRIKVLQRELKAIENKRLKITADINLNFKMNLVEQKKMYEDSITKLVNQIYEVQKNENLSNDVKAKQLRALQNALDVLSRKYKNVVESLQQFNTEQEKTEQNIRRLTPLTQTDIQQFSKMRQAIENLYQSGEDVTKLKALFFNASRDMKEKAIETIKAIYSNSFKKLKEEYGKNLEALPEELRNNLLQTEKVINSLGKNASIDSFVNVVTQLEIVTNKISKTKQYGLVEGLVAPLIEARDNLLKLKSEAETLKSIGKIDTNKLTITPYLNSAQFLSDLKDINNKAIELEKAQERYNQLLKDGFIIENKLKTIEEQLKETQKTRLTLNETLLQKQQELASLQQKINWYNKNGVANLDLKEKLIKKFKEVQKEVNSIQKRLMQTTKQELVLERKLTEEKIKQYQTLLKIEQQAKSYTSTEQQKWKNELHTKLLEIKQALNLQLNGNDAQRAVQAYFEIYKGELEKKLKEIEQIKKQYSNFSVMPSFISDNTMQVQSKLSEIVTFYNNLKNIEEQYYQDKITLATEKLQQLDELFRTHNITQIEYEKQKTQILQEMNQISIEHVKKSFEISFNQALSVAHGVLGTFDGILSDLYNAGIAKTKSMARALKMIRLGEAIINTYAAATKALATVPYPMNFAAMALVIARGMANAAMIKAQRFHTGGYVDDYGSSSRIGGLRDDEIPAILQKGEYVLSKKDVQLIKSINNSPTVNVEPVKPEVIVINQVDQEMFNQWAQSRKGREIIRNVINAG